MPQKGKPRGRSFQKGQSGNPNGRPSGKRNAATLIAEQLIDGEAEAVTRRIIEQAKAGEPHAQRLFMDRVLPPRRERYLQFDLPELKTPEHAPLAMAAVIRAVAEGQITLGEANEFAKLVQTYIQSLEVTEFASRLKLLEGLFNAKKSLDEARKPGKETWNHTGSDGGLFTS
jgi:hypothetical protein